MMANNTLKRNVFTEKLFEAIEEPWSNESTPSSTPVKKCYTSRRFADRLALDVENVDAIQLTQLHSTELTSAETFDDEPDFIVWKLAEKLFSCQQQKVIAAAFSMWVSEIYRTGKAKRLSQRSRTLYRRKLQLKIFNNWYGTVILTSGFGKMKSKIANFAALKSKRFLRAFFQRFKTSTLSVHLFSAMSRRWRSRTLRACIQKWSKLLAIRANNYIKSLKMAYMLCIRASFYSWSYFVKSKRRLVLVFEVFQRRMVRKVLNVCFKRWYQSKLSTMSIPSKNAWLAHHLDVHQRRRSSAALKEWNRISVHRRQVRSVFLKTICRKMFGGLASYECWCMQLSMTLWIENTQIRYINNKVCLSSNQKQRQQNPYQKSKIASISVVFKCWSNLCVVDRRIRIIATRHRQFKSVKVLKQCCKIWKLSVKAFQAADKKANSLYKYRKLNQKMRTFIVWKHALATSLAAANCCANAFRQKVLSRKHMIVWNRWRQRANRRIVLQRLYNSRARMKISAGFFLRTLFLDWKNGIISDQFFIRYISKRFFGLWAHLVQTPSVCLSSTDIQMFDDSPNRISQLKSLSEANNCTVSSLYRRKLLRVAVQLWASICLKHSALLEKLQIAYMIRSSIRTSTKIFNAWWNETLKASKTSMIPTSTRLVTSGFGSKPVDADQRTFEILNIALVERILWSQSSKHLIRKTFKAFFEFARQSISVSRSAKLAAIKRSFFSWLDIASSNMFHTAMKRITQAFRCWRVYVFRKATIKSRSLEINADRNSKLKKFALNALFTHTFGTTKAKNNSKGLQSGHSIHFAWKTYFVAFEAWQSWSAASVYHRRIMDDKVKSLFLQTTWRNAFNAWKCLCRTSKFFEKLRNSKKLCLIRSNFRAWSRCTFVKRNADKIIVSLQKYQATSMLILCWNAWRAGLEQRNYRTLTLSVAVKLIQKCNAVSVQVQIAWNAWRNFISTRRFVRLAKEKIARKVCDRANFRNMFKRWCSASRRRSNISRAISRVFTSSLRKGFVAFKYNMCRSVFFARQYQRISIKFRRQHEGSNHQVAFDPIVQKNKDGEFKPEVVVLEEKILELQSEKIDLMEQLKSALQGMHQEVQNAVRDQGCIKESHSCQHLIATHDDSQIASQFEPKFLDNSSCQHTLFHVESKQPSCVPSKQFQHPILSHQQHPLFPVLSHVTPQEFDSANHQDSRVAFCSGYSSSESGADSDHEADQFLNGILDDDGESFDGIDDVYEVSARPKTSTTRVNFAASPTGLKLNVSVSNSTSRPSSGKRPLSGKKVTPYGSIKVDSSSSRPKSAVCSEAYTSSGRLRTATGDCRRPISALTVAGLRPISAKPSALRDRDANIQPFNQWNDSMRVACENSKVKMVQSNGDQYFKERMEQVSRLQSKLLGALQTSAAVTSPMVDRQRGASKARLRPGFISGGGTRHLSQAADFSDTERVVYHPGL